MRNVLSDASPWLRDPTEVGGTSLSVRRVAILCALLLPQAALALGFGDLKLNSKLGQPVAAEIELIGDIGALPEGDCFRLAPGSDLETGYPWLRYGRLTVQRIDGKTKLLLSSTQPLWEPIVEIGLQIGCGIELSRRYTVLPTVADQVSMLEPLAPEAGTNPVAEAKPAAPASESEQAPSSVDWVAAEGESVRTLARILEPKNTKNRLKVIAALGSANPELRNAGKDWFLKPLPAGTSVKLPGTKASRSPAVSPAKVATAAKLRAPLASPANEASPEAKADKPASKASAVRQDRLVVGSDKLPSSGHAATSEREKELVRREEEMKSTMQRQDEELVAAKSRMQQLEQQLALLGERAKLLDERLRILNATPPAPAVEPIASSGRSVSETALLGLGLVGLAGLGAYFLRRRGDGEVSHARLSKQSKRSSDANKDVTVLDPFDERSTVAEGGEGDIAVVHHSSSEGMAKAVAKAKAVQAGAGKAALSLDEEDAVVELAEVLLSLSMSAHAVETLVAYIEANPKKAITPWLKLMKMYRETGRREDFDRLAGEIMTAFNIDRISWDDFDISENNAGIEQYQHIEQKLVSCWGTSECLQYLKHLLADNRDGSRAGFPIEVINEILMLIGVLKTRDTVAI